MKNYKLFRDMLIEEYKKKFQEFAGTAEFMFLKPTPEAQAKYALAILHTQDGEVTDAMREVCAYLKITPGKQAILKYLQKE